ncbi:MAG: hypothetical protein QOE70_2540 [Chthoniobacter sp.]|nr:hypothetical protein [Chthoniobacter sp.]
MGSFARDLDEKLPWLMSSMPCLRPRLSFFETPRNAEWLAGQTPAENVVLRYVGNRDRVNFAVRLLAKIRFVCLLAELVPVRREHTFTACFLESDAEATDAAK